jgi:hypothetical protein
MIAFFPGFLLACDVIETVGRLVPGTGCVMIVHSHFVSLSSPWGEPGGAINLNDVQSANISDTSFYSCSAPTAHGGAIFRATTDYWLDLCRCCAVNCWARDSGNVIRVGAAYTVLVSLLETSMVQCGVNPNTNTNTNADGGI